MIAYSKERFHNAVALFSKYHKEITRKKAYKTYIFKYLALLDFAMLKKQGKPVFDIEYDALKWGPVPRKLYNKIDEFTSDVFEIKEDGNGNHYFEAKKEPDPDYFSKEELSVIEQIKENVMKPRLTTDELIDIVHKEVKSWDKAWGGRGCKKKVRMDYADEFDNIFEKEELTPVEESFLVHRGLELASKCRPRDRY